MTNSCKRSFSGVSMRLVLFGSLLVSRLAWSQSVRPNLPAGAIRPDAKNQSLPGAAHLIQAPLVKCPPSLRVSAKGNGRPGPTAVSGFSSVNPSFPAISVPPFVVAER
jgi:hypothetical protein